MRRWTLRVLCWLAASAIANVALALGLWGLSSVRARAMVTDVAPRWPVPEYAMPEWGNCDESRCSRAIGCTVRVAAAYEYKSSGSSRNGRMSLERTHSMMAVFAGWPLPCLRVVRTGDLRLSAVSCPTALSNGHEGTELPLSWRGRWDSQFWTVPTHIWWAGLFLNAVIDVGLLGAFVYGRRLVRFWHRKCTRLCLHCGYPAGEMIKPCPECGASLAMPPDVARRIELFSLWSGRLRRTGKWVGLAAILALLVMECASYWILAEAHSPFGQGVQVWKGAAKVPWGRTRHQADDQWSFTVVVMSDGSSFRWWFELPDGSKYAALWLPLWSLAVAAALPTVWLWRRDLRGQLSTLANGAIRT